MSLKNIKKAFNYIILLSSLSILPGCTDWIKDQFGCLSNSSCCGGHGSHDAHGPKGASLTGETLLSVDGQSLVSVSSFEEFWKMYVEGNPQAALIAGFYPGLRKEVFATILVPFEIAKVYLEKTGKDKSTDFQKLFERQCEFVYKTLALDILHKDILEKINKSPQALREFYEENREKVRAFQDSKFTKSQGGTSAVLVEFDNDNDANAFLEKAKVNSNFTKLAQEDNKEVKQLGLVTLETPEINYFVKVKLNELGADGVAKVDLGKDKFVVVKALDKKKAEYATFDELMQDPRAREVIERELVQVKSVEKMKEEMELLKKKYNIQQNNEFFEQELEKKQAELSKMQQDLNVLNEDIETVVGDQAATEDAKA